MQNYNLTKTLTNYLLAIALGFSTYSWAIAANAGDSKVQATEFKFAVVDYEKVLEDSLALREVRSNLEKKLEGFHKEVSEKEDALRKKDQDLSAKKSVLSHEAYEVELKKFREEVESTQKYAGAKRAEINNAFANASEMVQKEVTKIVEKKAIDEGYQAIFQLNQFLYVKSDFDKTIEVIAELNKNLPKVSISMSEDTTKKESEKKKNKK